MPEQEDIMSEVKQLRLQLKERDARISQLEASEKHLQAELQELEATVLQSSEVIYFATQVLKGYTADLNALADAIEQTKENSGKAAPPSIVEEAPAPGTAQTHRES